MILFTKEKNKILEVQSCKILAVEYEIKRNIHYLRAHREKKLEFIGLRKTCIMQPLYVFCWQSLIVLRRYIRRRAIQSH